MNLPNRVRLFSIIPLAMASLGFAPSVVAEELDEAELFFELNDTDDDLGIHMFIDGGPYTRLNVKGPDGRKLLNLRASGRLARQGLTELFTESAEPTFEELSVRKFLRRFPEGDYQIDAADGEGNEFDATVSLSHVLAAPAGNITVNGVAGVENCDVVPLPTASSPVIIDWDPVTTSHPELGASGPVEIVRYQFFAELEENDEIKFGADLPPNVTRFRVPQEILNTGSVFKYEIIARTASGNNTAIESCFTYVP